MRSTITKSLGTICYIGREAEKPAEGSRLGQLFPVDFTPFRLVVACSTDIKHLIGSLHPVAYIENKEAPIDCLP